MYNNSHSKTYNKLLIQSISLPVILFKINQKISILIGFPSVILLAQLRRLLQYIDYTSCQALPHQHTVNMNYLKVYDSLLSHSHHSSLLQFLDKKQKCRSADNVSVFTEESYQQKTSASRVCPSFSFTFTTYQVSEYVQYNVILNESYKILGRTIINHYNFRTRYSMLQALDRKLGSMGLPGKKVFGNKNPIFVQKRKKELQVYLNRVAGSGKPQFLKLVEQIKLNDYNATLKQTFTIE